MERPLLSICIPTFNRASELQNALSTIYGQLARSKEINQKVEVVVSNNASEDNTNEVVASFRGQILNLKYLENKNNIGFDKNVLNVIENSSGEYCLTLGDDDGILEGGIEAMLRVIEGTRCPYILLNHQGFDHELNSPITLPNRLQETDLEYGTLQEFVSTIKDTMSLVGTFGGMSVQLFNRQIWMEFPEKEQYIGTQTIHLFILISAFKDKPVTLMRQPTIMSRNANLRWDSFPGLESERRRTQKTIEAAQWINNLYELGLDSERIKRNLVWRGRVNILKRYIKNILFWIGLRKK